MLNNTLETLFNMSLNAELKMIHHQYQHHTHHHYHIDHLLQHHYHHHHHHNQHLENKTNLTHSLNNHELHLQQRNYIHHPQRITHVISPLQRDQQLINRPKSASSKQRTQIQFFLYAALAYVLSPIDLIPEMIFGVFGMLDDILFLFMCLFCIAIILVFPLIREMQRTILDKLGFKQEPWTANKKF